MALKLETAHRRLAGSEYGTMPGNGEILEYTVKVGRDEPVDAAAAALERLNAVNIPPDAWLSARVNLAPHPDDEANYKSLNGMSMVPTDPYKNPLHFADSLLRLTDNVANKQTVLSVTIRLAIAPRGFFAMHGAGLMGGPRTALSEGSVYVEGPRGGAIKQPSRRKRPTERAILRANLAKLRQITDKPKKSKKRGR